MRAPEQQRQPATGAVDNAPGRVTRRKHAELAFHALPRDGIGTISHLVLPALMADFKAIIKGEPVKLANCSQCAAELWAPQELDTVICSSCTPSHGDQRD